MSGIFLAAVSASPAHPRFEPLFSTAWGAMVSFNEILEWRGWDWPGWEVLQHIVEILAIVAIVFAIKQYRDAREHSLELTHIISNLNTIITKLSTQTTQLLHVEKSLSTQYLGVFPNFLDEIREVVSRARQSILILCDLPAYACFTDAQRSRDYIHEITVKRDAGIEVKAIFFSPARQDEFLHEYFGPHRIKDWEQFKDAFENRSRIDQFIDRNMQVAGLPKAKRETLTRDELMQLILAKNAQTFEQTFAHVNEALVTGEEMTVYFWMVDEHEAVFTISARSEDATDYGFRTLDSDLITALSDMWNVYARKDRPPAE